MALFKSLLSLLSLSRLSSLLYLLSPSPLPSFLFSSHLFFLFKLNIYGHNWPFLLQLWKLIGFVSFFRTKLCFKVLVTKLCLTLCDPMDCSPPRSSVHGILQARILQWLAIPSPGDLPDPGIKPGSPSCIAIPGGSVVKNTPANAEDVGSIPGSGRSPGGGKWQPTPVFLPGESHRQRSLAGYNPEGHKESDTT